MKRPIVTIGIGEIAGVLAKGFLRSGHPVYPVTRKMDATQVASEIPDPFIVVVGVAEKDYPSVMESMPDSWRDRLVLIQNELLPRDWETFGIQNPTVMSVWFEKKKGIDVNPILPSPVYGPKAEVIARSLTNTGIPSEVLTSEEDLLLQLVQKNVYIFTINIAGLVLEERATTATLWAANRELAVDVANEVIDLQEALIGQTLSREKLLEGLLKAFEGDPHHILKGRSAPGRLDRLMEIADEKGLEIKAIRSVAKQLERGPNPQNV